MCDGIGNDLMVLFLQMTHEIRTEAKFFRGINGGSEL
jgi:hypothetical protein